MADAASYHQLLLVEDSPSLATVYQEYLRAGPYNIRHAHCIADALKFADQAMPDGVLLDLRLPDGDGLSVLRELRGRDPDLPVVVMTAHGSVALAVEAMQAGASDFLVKPFAPERLTVTVANVMERAALRRQVAELAAVVPRQGFAGFIGAAPAMQAVYRILENAAASRATVFVTGESGTGKELAAEAVHGISPRKAGPFIAINCAAIPKDLIESEIFGHVRGAFTGAVAERIGAARAADGGTLFLDEICEMDLALQGKLLRFIQTGTFQPVGSGKTLQTDVRFVCATNRDPLEEVRAGRFREDLYYRLNVFPLEIAALRHRPADILPLARHALARQAAAQKRTAKFAAAAEERLAAHVWPGNVRELENVVQRALILAAGDSIEAGDLALSRVEAAVPAASLPAAETAVPPASTFAAAPVAGPIPATPGPAGPANMKDLERQHILDTLASVGGSRKKAVAILGISERTLRYKLAQYREEGFYKDDGEDE